VIIILLSCFYLRVNPLRRAIEESEKLARESAAKERRPLPTAGTSNTTSKGKRKIQEVVIVDDSDEEERPPPVRKDKTQHGNKSNGDKSNGRSASTLPSTAPGLLPPATEDAAPSITASSSTSSTFLLDRAALEKERLERQKRLRGDVNAPASSSDDEEESQEGADAGKDQRDAKRRKVDGSSAAPNQLPVVPSPAGPSHGSRNHASTSYSTAKSGPKLFLDGQVRPTWNRFANDGRKRFKIEDIIGDVSQVRLIVR
jgi:tyrosyl-DNA phosphodiesterase-1